MTSRRVYQMYRPPVVDSALIQPNSSPVTQPMSAISASSSTPERAQKMNLRGQEAFLPAQSRPTKGSTTRATA